jgi:hypothetical protein
MKTKERAQAWKAKMLLWIQDPSSFCGTPGRVGWAPGLQGAQDHGTESRSPLGAPGQMALYNCMDCLGGHLQVTAQAHFQS